MGTRSRGGQGLNDGMGEKALTNHRQSVPLERVCMRIKVKTVLAEWRFVVRGSRFVVLTGRGCMMRIEGLEVYGVRYDGVKVGSRQAEVKGGWRWEMEMEVEVVAQLYL